MRLSSKTGLGTIGYGSTAPYHGAKTATSRSYGYDAENRLVSVSVGATASFIYDGDGNRIKGTTGGVTTTYIGNYAEWSGSTMKKYYYVGAVRIGMKAGTTVSYLLGDHLGSTTITTNSSGAFSAELRYKPWGESRNPTGTTPTTYRFTGQREQSEIGLYYYGARWYDSSLGRFTSPDTIVPGAGNPLAWDRFSYVQNNPVRYADPSGHVASPPMHDYDGDRPKNYDTPPGQNNPTDDTNTSPDLSKIFTEDTSDLYLNENNPVGSNNFDNQLDSFEGTNCPGAIAAGALLFVSLAPIDAALVVANMEVIAIPGIGPFVEVGVLIPVDLVVFDLHFVAASLMWQGMNQPCEEVELSLLPPWGFDH